MRARRALILLSLPCCATLGSTGAGDVGLPTAGVGPFRKLAMTEDLGVAPYVLDAPAANYREPAALAAAPDDPSNASVFLYAVAAVGTGKTAHDAIVRTRADDARSFYGTALDFGRTPLVVLSADAPWEGADLAGPSAVRIGTEVFLYYSASLGIGLARSFEGTTFTKSPAPVLARDPTVAWETTTPAAPSVAVYPDGRIRMLYAAGLSIGEAESEDGLSWRRLDADPSTPEDDPVLSPSAPVDGEGDGGSANGPFDTAQVSDPCLAPRITPAGRLEVRVLYTGFTAPPGAPSRASAIGFAARYGDAGPLIRQAQAVLTLAKHEAAPALFEWSEQSMLYVHMDETTATPPYRAIAAAYAPAQDLLPAPNAYAKSP